MRQRIGFPAGPSLALATGIVAWLAGLAPAACWTAAVTVLCAVWWLTEAIPIPATSLIPFAAFPLLGVLDHAEVAHAYGHHLVLLLFGGFVLSQAIERCGAHRRLALGMVRAFGRLGRRGLVLGFMAATAACSMWISNTATVLMILPVASALLAREDQADLRAPLLLGIAYAGSIGGIGTPIGTPPNATFMAIYEEHTKQAVSFVEWMRWGVPTVAVLVPIAWLLLVRRVAPGAVARLPHPGPWRTSEVRVLALCSVTAMLWITREAPFLAGGWSAWFDIASAGDETVALAAVCAAFVIPSGDRSGERLLDWESAARIPWGLLLLFAGGIAIAMAFGKSGLSATIGAALRSAASWPAPVLVGTLALGVTFLTEVTSNTATTVLLMPILAGAALQAGQEPRLMMVPAAMSASCAFMLPVATAPNAIVFGTGQVPITRMAREGLWLNLAGAAVITAVTLLLV
ncbi:MAG: SLC13/DASS family transporter [Planctomycetes bacterium]|nr:SLC13/DASS family transporter [Planctomycetota bacterium]